jgi:hypothetical protein
MTFDLTRRAVPEEQEGRILPRKHGGSVHKIEEKYEEVAQLI